MPVKVNLVTSNNRLESRMREIRQSGSAGGEVQINGPFLPLSLTFAYFDFCHMCQSNGVQLAA